MNEESQERVVLDCVAGLSKVKSLLNHIECPIIDKYREHFEIELKLLNDIVDLSKKYVESQKAVSEPKEIKKEDVLKFIDEYPRGVSLTSIDQNFLCRDHVNKIISTLFNEGDIFEIKPGVVKVLK